MQVVKQGRDTSGRVRVNVASCKLHFKDSAIAGQLTRAVFTSLQGIDSLDT